MAIATAISRFHSSRAQEGGGIEYLILVDRSARMAARQAATERTVEDLVRTGFHERIRAGEHFAVWFFDQGVSTNAVVLSWDSRRIDEAVTGVSLLFRIAAQGSQTADLASALMGPGRKLTIVLTDGYRSLTGTAFDGAMNASMAAHREQFDRAGKPFLISLAPRGNQWFGFSIHTNLGSVIEFPAAPPEVVAVAPPKKEPAVVEKKPVVEKKTEPKKEAEVVIPPKVVRVEKPVEVAVQPPPPIVVVKPKAEPKLEVKVAEKVELPHPVEPEPKPVPEPAQTNPVAVAVAPPSSSGPEVATVPPDPFPWGVLAGVLGLIAAGGSAVCLKLRSAPKKSGSIISQSLGPAPRTGQKR